LDEEGTSDLRNDTTLIDLLRLVARLAKDASIKYPKHSGLEVNSVERWCQRCWSRLSTSVQELADKPAPTDSMEDDGWTALAALRARAVFETEYGTRAVKSARSDDGTDSCLHQLLPATCGEWVRFKNGDQTRVREVVIEPQDDQLLINKKPL
ncbi:unnamed protein product, partial [marine sediment metagenome]